MKVTDLVYPFQVDANGDLAYTRSLGEHVQQSVLMILDNQPETTPMRMEFGMRWIMFGNLPEQDINAVHVKKEVMRQEPRITSIPEVYVVPKDDILEINLNYDIINGESYRISPEVAIIGMQNA